MEATVSEPEHFYQVSIALGRLRQQLSVTQAAVAHRAGLDQSRISRIEKGERGTPEEIVRTLDALAALGSPEASALKDFAKLEWRFVEPPSFWNPDRACLEIADEALGRIEEFLADEERPWPLRRQMERHRDTLLRGTTFLSRVNHNIAFIGEIGVGKSTALSFVFDLLVPPSVAERPMDRPVLETGAGGTTICEVHIKRGPEFGIFVVPVDDSELTQSVADFCAAKFLIAHSAQRDGSDTIGVSREVERAIRNMCGLVRRRGVGHDGKPNPDPVMELARSCASEDELRARILEAMNLSERTRREVWYDSATRKNPLEWLSRAFRDVNNGRMADVMLPRSIDLLIPDFAKAFGELEITVIDTKGVDDVAVREDLDQRLKDPRTAVVFCSRFNDAPGTSSKLLLQHMRQTFSEPVNTGKVSILALPRSGEARAMKDDAGEQALDDQEGYAFKKMQVDGELAADDLIGVPMMFFNVEGDQAEGVRLELLRQLARMRATVADRVFDLCAAADELIQNSEAQALNAALEEVASRLNMFLRTHGRAGARERNAYEEALSTIGSIRYAATLWAATRRNGEYYGLSVLHQIGVGAARDARTRTASWFKSLEDYLAVMRDDSGLALASRSIEQINQSAQASRTIFLEAVQRAGMEVYREALGQSDVWIHCASEWGQGPGFKVRVAGRLRQWFESHQELKDRLEGIVESLWHQHVMAPIMRLVAEEAPEAGAKGTVIQFPSRPAA